MHPRTYSRANYTLGLVTKLFVSCVLLALTQWTIFAQNDSNTPLGLKPGNVTGSYGLTNIDTVNLFSGRVTVKLPREIVMGRGQAGTQYFWSWDSPMRWQVYKSTDLNGNPVYGAGFGGGNPWFGAPYGFLQGMHVVYPVGTGWGGPTQCDIDGYVWAWDKTLTRLIWVEPDGTEHEMRDVLTNGQPKSGAGCNSGQPGHSANRGRVFVATDGSGATYVSDQAIRDGAYSGFEFPYNYDDDWTGWLLLKDGRRIRVSWDNDRGLKDRNGNQYKTPFMGTPTDALNRTLGNGGQLTSTECSALVAGETRCHYTAQKGFGGAERRSHFFHDQNGRLTRLMLPNGRSYVFYYNNFDDLTRVDLPTGGSIEYTFEAGLQGNPGTPMQPWWPSGLYGDSGPNDMHFYRRITERRVYKEGHVLESRQTFSKPESDHLTTVGYVEKKNYDGSSVLLSTERHYFYGNAEHSFWLNPTEYSSWLDGHEYKTETYDASGNLMKTVLTFWEQRAPVSWWTGSSNDAPPNDPRISQITTILENGAQFTNSYGYDPAVPYNSLIDFIERDYNLNTLRRTQTTYLKTLNGVDYAGLNVQNGSELHIRDLPVQQSISFGNVEESRTTYEYDNYTATANHALLLSRPNISGLDPAFTTSYVTRGNVTAITRHLLTNGTPTGSVTSYLQYDVAGNVVKTIDERGNPTTFDFTDRFGGPNGEARSNTSPSELSSVGQSSYAFPTRVINALNMESFYQIDFYLGQAVDAEDINGIVSSAYFDDSLNRPTRMIVAANNSTLKTQTNFSYDDVNRVVTTTSDLAQYLDNLKKTDTKFDGLGRQVEARTYESASNYIVTKQTYGGLSSQVSNPYRPWQGETAQWTTTVIDPLGRVKSVTTPDSAVVSTSYTGNETTVTDQTGKKRKSISDSLGRISRIYEDPLGLNHETIYGYNSLGNLVSVAQTTLSQPLRTFVYDSFGRLVSATNPESGTTTFKYDEVGNLVVKTDARGVSTHVSYDALNRPTRRWYNGSNATTATTHNSPVIPAGVGTSLEANYFYDQQTLPAGAPSFTRGPSKGALVAVTYGTGSSDGNYFGRDPVGRDSLKIQRTSGVNYQMSLGYNAVGAITSLTYPSGRSVNYTYDGTGRLLSLAGNLGDGTGRTYANNLTYSPFGGLTREDFGTNTPLYHKSFYNVRGQLFDTRLSSVNDAWDWNRGRHILYYSSNHLWGQSGADNNGTVRSAETWIPPANATLDQADTLIEDIYTYDSLNRLKNVSEQKTSVAGGWGTWQQQFRQEYTYDRWGNRTINAAQTWGTGINNKQFTVTPGNNRLGVPVGQSGVMAYDASGNLTNDTYTGAGNRTYDAENRITSAWGGNNQAQLYSYDAIGERIKRSVNGVETWQVYGFGGELLAEYPASGAANRPQMEYGYRNGELLISAVGRVNVALAANGAVATASSTATGSGFSAAFAINGNNRGPWGNSLEGWNDNTPNSMPDWIQVDFAASKTINEIDVFSLHDNYTQQNTPSETQTFTLYGLLGFDVQYWNGSTWVTVPGGSVTGNNKVWRKFTFSNITTSKIRVHINTVPDSWSRVVEIQAYEPSTTGERIEWTVTDQLGTPRMIVDQTGAYTSVRRHDYLPFGEELPAGVGSRTTALGYVADATRQRFTGYEADGETGLNYAQARYQSSVQGRFTSSDPLSGNIADPQSWNMYSYVGNNPVNRTDPTGMSYFMGSGANDPFIRENEYRVDGFDMSPPGTASNLTDESMLSYAPNWFLLNEGMPSSNSSSEPDPPDYGEPVEVIIWGGTTNGGRDSSSAFGHVSYVINGYSYSWQAHVDPDTGKEEWLRMEPVAYVNERRQLSAGKGYVLDLGSADRNQQFGRAIINAYDGKGGYHLLKNNCGHAFQRAVNEMKLGGFWRNNSIRPSQHEKFIKAYLSDYIIRVNTYSKGGHIN